MKKKNKHIGLEGLRTNECELKKSVVATSPTILKSLSLVVFIYLKVTNRGVPQGVPRFVNGGPRTLCLEYHTCAYCRRRLARAGLGLGLGSVLLFSREID
jgi:hypothetical protein